MMRISPNRRRFSFAFTFFLSLVAVLLLLSLLFAVRIPLSGGLWGIGIPILRARESLLSIGTSLQAQFSSKATLLAQNEALQAQLASSTAALADRNMLYQETLDLKSRLGRDGTVSSVLGTILLRPPALPYDTLLVDVGTKSGIVVGDVVAAGGTTLIGFVSQADTSVSYVTLFSAPGQSYNALLHTQQGSTIPFSMEGEGGGVLMGKLPAGTAVQPEDSVEFPSIAGGFIGTVSAVVAPQNQSFESVYVHEPVNVQELQYVEIWKQHE